MLRGFLRNLHSGPLALQLRRFVVVGAATAGVQMLLLWLFVDISGLYYLVGALFSIEITIVLSYVLNNAWTFQATPNTGVEFFYGLVRTNVVRGTAIPIQIGILYGLVEWLSLFYLVANAVAILLSGVYRYVLDAKWTWGQ
ncbi:GtrA family protein [Halobellus clavatus]|jgi:putative flippase GtrA|uniref:Putative flippase GtrA (Transmembrane translocase of bactoprenol-linked glucose) n=1 Tax=Halobellus clavatus TaxID=660517 RepID=A0A1H3EC61_9EURY|nr:GtrA family protein [Halobellus clavatus]SDX76306.1 Putative flippase GtrA (transmembrane translocase of bactoprenol-linked glucose) [Halobellus clavatus]